MFRRVEVCFPIESKRLSNRILHDLELYLKDNTQAWLLQSDGSYQRCIQAENEASVCAQTQILQELQA
jgi:polyphosphate kinase